MYEIHVFIIHIAVQYPLIDKHVTQSGISILVASLKQPFTFLSV